MVENTQYKGALTEQKCFLKCIEMGFTISKPVFDNARYDFILDTGKNLLIYNDDQIEFDLKDYQGNIEKVNQRYGCCLVPTTYELGKSEEYTYLISDESSKRAIYEEG